MKKIILTTAALALSFNVFAQYEGTYFDDRIGHGSDSIEVRQNVSLFTIAMQDKKYDEAIEYWQYIIEKAPIARLDTYTKGAVMFEKLIEGTDDKEKKVNYLNQLLGIYDTRLANAELLNQCADISPKTTRGPVLCRKAYDYAHYANGIFDDYTLEKAYDNFTEGINLVNEDPSIEIESFVLTEYFLTSYKRYQADAGFREQFINDYILCRDVCEKMLAKANETDNKAMSEYIVKSYDPVYNYVNNSFAYSQAADKDQLVAMYENRIDEKKDDAKYLKSALRVLQDNYCEDTEVYLRAAKYAYDIQPDYFSTLALATGMVKTDMDEAIKYYNEAIELCEDNNKKADICYDIASLLGRNGMLSKAEPYLLKTESLKPEYKGRCDLYRARRDASEKKFDSALTYAKLAGEEDPSIQGTAQRLTETIIDWKASLEKYEAEQRAALEKQRQIEAEQARLRAQREAQLKAEQQAAAAAKAKENAAQRQAREQQNAAAKAEYERKMAEYRKQKAAYDAQMAKQKKLDDFWKGR